MVNFNYNCYYYFHLLRFYDWEVFIKFFGVYTSTLTRCVPYLIGIFVGFLIDKFEPLRDEKLKFSKIFQIILWLLVSMWCIVPFISPQTPCDQDNCKTKILFYVLESSHKIGWSLSIGWIIIACHFGLSKIINRFLSNTFWIPIAKISLSLYLIHPLVQMNFIATHQLEENFDFMNVVSENEKKKTIKPIERLFIWFICLYVIVYFR